MALPSGSKLGPYEIVGELGAGGMGEVYKAKDARLDRTVAIKVLPEHLSNDVQLRERFEREARAVSGLNHPHICTLHDVGSEEGVDFLVLEYIEGETLADRLKKGALDLDEALRYGVQIADALDNAHRQGVVHRDLEPGNRRARNYSTPNGGELFYRTPEGMVVVDVETEPSFRPGTPRLLFEGRFPDRAPGDPARYGVAPDAERFLMIAPAADGEVSPPEIHIALNWFDELERLAPHP